MEIQNLDIDNVLRIWVSVYALSGIAIKATFGIWDTPMTRYETQKKETEVEKGRGKETEKETDRLRETRKNKYWRIDRRETEIYWREQRDRENTVWANTNATKKSHSLAF